MRFVLLLLVSACLFLWACEKPAEQGEIARVNGRSITAMELAAIHEIGRIHGEVSISKTAEALQEEYGEALASLIILTLVTETLEKEKIPVTKEELLAAEEGIRNEYPAGFFEESLLEGGIDLNKWRFILTNNLAMGKFIQHILRPKISIHPEEIEEYYQIHKEQYYIPELYEYYTIQGSRKKDVELARDLFCSTASVADVEAAFPEVNILANSLPVDRIPPKAVKAFTNKKAFFRSPVETEDDGYTCYIYKSSMAARLQAPAEAYPLVEAALLAPKLEIAMEEWLLRRINKSTIVLDTRLLPQLTLGYGKNATSMADTTANATQQPVVDVDDGTENTWSNATLMPDITGEVSGDIEVD